MAFQDMLKEWNINSDKKTCATRRSDRSLKVKPSVLDLISPSDPPALVGISSEGKWRQRWSYYSQLLQNNLRNRRDIQLPLWLFSAWNLYKAMIIIIIINERSVFQAHNIGNEKTQLQWKQEKNKSLSWVWDVSLYTCWTLTSTYIHFA